jgi:hypothetical protein
MRQALIDYGNAENIPYRFDAVTHRPNSFDAHRLVRWAQGQGKGGAAKEALFRAYFNEARDVGDHGVLVDIAQKVWRCEPVDVTMGHFNTIWQGDANALALQFLEHAAAPAWKINLTGSATLHVRAVAEAMAQKFARPLILTGQEAPDALLSDSSLCRSLLASPSVPEADLIGWVASWVQNGGSLLGKPTHFESRDGKF